MSDDPKRSPTPPILSTILAGTGCSFFFNAMNSQNNNAASTTLNHVSGNSPRVMSLPKSPVVPAIKTAI